MALNPWQRNIVDEDGNVISGAEVEVFYAGTTDKPDLFSDNIGTPKLNPFNADASGFAQFFCSPSSVDIAVNGFILWVDVNISDLFDEDMLDDFVSTGQISGFVTGPASVSSDQIALFDGASGKLVKAGQTIAQYFTSYLDAFLVTLYNIFPRTLNTYADIAATPIAIGQKFSIKQHTYPGLGGGTFIGVSSTGLNPNLGTISTTATTGVFAERLLEGRCPTPDDFGARGNGSVDDTIALQAFFDWIENSTGKFGYQYSNADMGCQTQFGARQVMSSRTCAYAISDTLYLRSNYANFDFNNCAFIPHASFDLNKYAFDITAWVCKFSNIRTAKFKKVYKLFNANLNIGRVVFDNVYASNSEVWFDIDLRSTLTTITNWRADDVDAVAVVRSGDAVAFDEGWLSARSFSNTADAHFSLVGINDAGLTIRKMLYVPWPQEVEDTAIVKITGSPSRVTLTDCHFGGEPGQIPLVSNYVSGGVPGSRGNHITIDNCMGYTTNSGGSPSNTARPAVELFVLPDSVVFQNYFGSIEEGHTQGLVAFNPRFHTYAAALGFLGAEKFRLYINGRTPRNFGGIPWASGDTLALSDCSPLPVARSLFKAVTSASVAGNTLFASGASGRSDTYRVMLLSQSNSAADRYSEYIVAATDAAPPLAQWSIIPIIEGVSTAAGRLVLDAGDVKVRGNSVAPVDVLVIVQRLTNLDPL